MIGMCLKSCWMSINSDINFQKISDSLWTCCRFFFVLLWPQCVIDPLSRGAGEPSCCCSLFPQTVWTRCTTWPCWPPVTTPSSRWARSDCSRVCSQVAASSPPRARPAHEATRSTSRSTHPEISATLSSGISSLCCQRTAKNKCSMSLYTELTWHLVLRYQDFLWPSPVGTGVGWCNHGLTPTVSFK